MTPPTRTSATPTPHDLPVIVRWDALTAIMLRAPPRFGGWPHGARWLRSYRPLLGDFLGLLGDEGLRLHKRQTLVHFLPLSPKQGTPNASHVNIPPSLTVLMPRGIHDASCTCTMHRCASAQKRDWKIRHLCPIASVRIVEIVGHAHRTLRTLV